MAYSTSRAYIKSDGSQTDYFANGPHFGGVIRFTASRSSFNSTDVTVNVDTYIGFGTFANTSSYTGYDVTARGWYGNNSWADRTAGTYKLIHDNSESGRWNCTSSTAEFFSAHDDDSNIDKKMKKVRKANDIGSFTISNWKSGSKTVYFQLVNNGNQPVFSVSLPCPTYKVKVTLNPNGGTIDSNSSWEGSGTSGVYKMAGYNDEIGNLPWGSINRDGYIKRKHDPDKDGNATDNTCWYTSTSNDTMVSSSDKYTSDTTIYAQWRTGVSGSVSASTITYGSSATVKYTAVSGTNNAVKAWTLYIDGDSVKTGTSATSSGSYTASGLSAGSHSLKISVTGKYGDPQNFTGTLTVNKASNPMTYGSEGSWSTTYSPSSARTVTVAAASNAVGTVTYSLVSQKQGSTNVSYFSFNTSTRVLTAAAGTPAGSYTVTVRAVAAGNSNYNSETLNRAIAVTIDKASSSISVSPTSLSIQYPGSKDFTATFTNCDLNTYATADTSIATTTHPEAGKFTVTAKKPGTTSVTVTGTAASSNYSAPASKSVSVTVTKGTSSFSPDPTPLTLTYPTSKTITCTCSHCNISGSSVSVDGIVSYTRSGNTFTITPLKQGSTVLTITGTSSDSVYYNNPASKTVTINVNRGPQTISFNPSSTSGTFTFPTEETNFTATATGSGSAAGGALSVASSNTNIANASITNGTVNIWFNGYGSTTITVTAAQTDQYNQATKTYAVTIQKRTVSITAPTLTTGTLTYDGTAKTLANAGSCTAGGTMYYYVGTSSTAPTFSISTWSTSMPTKTDANNGNPYYIYWYCYVSDTANNQGTNINTVKSLGSRTINKATNPITWGTTGSWQPTYSTSDQSTSIVTPTSAQGTVTYSLTSQKQGSTAVSYFSVNSSSGAITMAASTPANVYTVVVKATAAGNGNYNSGYKERTITVTEKVTITLNDNGGSGGSGTVTILYGTTAGNYPSVAKPSRTGYEFTGYYSATSGGTKWYNEGPSSVQTFNLTAPTTWYAQWSPKIRAWIKTENGWKQVTSVWIRNNTAWKQATQLFTRDNNTWKV